MLLSFIFVLFNLFISIRYGVSFQVYFETWETFSFEPTFTLKPLINLNPLLKSSSYYLRNAAFILDSSLDKLKTKSSFAAGMNKGAENFCKDFKRHLKEFECKNFYKKIYVINLYDSVLNFLQFYYANSKDQNLLTSTFEQLAAELVGGIPLFESYLDIYEANFIAYRRKNSSSTSASAHYNLCLWGQNKLPSVMPLVISLLHWVSGESESMDGSNNTYRLGISYLMTTTDLSSVSHDWRVIIESMSFEDRQIAGQKIQLQTHAPRESPHDSTMAYCDFLHVLKPNKSDFQELKGALEEYMDHIEEAVQHNQVPSRPYTIILLDAAQDTFEVIKTTTQRLAVTVRQEKSHYIEWYSYVAPGRLVGNPGMALGKLTTARTLETHYSNFKLVISDEIMHRQIADGSFYPPNFHSIRMSHKEKIQALYGDQSNHTLIMVSFPYNGEFIVPYHLDYIYDYVDVIIITESWYSHSGKKKPFLYIHENSDVFVPYLLKIHFVVIDSFPDMPEYFPVKLTTYMTLNSSVDFFAEQNKDLCMEGHQSYLRSIDPNEKNHTKYFERWFREQYQRDLSLDYIHSKFKGRKFVVALVDADEILQRSFLDKLRNIYFDLDYPHKLSMKFFYYNFHFVKKALWDMPLVMNDLSLLYTPPSHLRMLKTLKLEDTGWHCSYFMSVNEIVRKLQSFLHSEYNHEVFNKTELIQRRIQYGLDILDRKGGDQLLPFQEFDSLPFQLQRAHYDLLRYQKMASSDGQELQIHSLICLTIERPEYKPLALTMRLHLITKGFTQVKIYRYGYAHDLADEKLRIWEPMDPQEPSIDYQDAIQIVIGLDSLPSFLLPKYILIPGLVQRNNSRNAQDELLNRHLDLLPHLDMLRQDACATILFQCNDSQPIMPKSSEVPRLIRFASKGSAFLISVPRCQTTPFILNDRQLDHSMEPSLPLQDSLGLQVLENFNVIADSPIDNVILNYLSL